MEIFHKYSVPIDPYWKTFFLKRYLEVHWGGAGKGEGRGEKEKKRLPAEPINLLVVTYCFSGNAFAASENRVHLLFRKPQILILQQ